MDLVILTPDAQVYEGQIERISAPGVAGEFEILTNHAPLVSALGEGTVMITTADRQNLTFEIKGGFMEVLNNNISVLAGSVKE
ncbi:MAG: ATP synthase F1 subunit epsilon [Aureispira sp.]|nr:ATP synthase F1 subunit epsilon [Aureispira sp.]